MLGGRNCLFEVKMPLAPSHHGKKTANLPGEVFMLSPSTSRRPCQKIQKLKTPLTFTITLKTALAANLDIESSLPLHHQPQDRIGGTFRY